MPIIYWSTVLQRYFIISNRKGKKSILPSCMSMPASLSSALRCSTLTTVTQFFPRRAQTLNFVSIPTRSVCGPQNNWFINPPSNYHPMSWNCLHCLAHSLTHSLHSSFIHAYIDRWRVLDHLPLLSNFNMACSSPLRDGESQWTWSWFITSRGIMSTNKLMFLYQ